MINFFGTVFSPLTNLLGSGKVLPHSGSALVSNVAFTHDCHWTYLPLTLKQVKSMHVCKTQKPEMDRLRAKYQDNGEATGRDDEAARASG